MPGVEASLLRNGADSKVSSVYTTLDGITTGDINAGDINNLGQVVGTQFVVGGGGLHGFLYSDGHYTTIDDPLAFVTSTSGTSVLGINDQGQIVGTYTDHSGDHGFLANYVIAPDDFNNDTFGDILFRNDDGRLSIWEMNGTVLVKGATVGGAPTLDATWHNADTGDFNGDGLSDILLRNDDGRVSVWEMNGFSLSGGQTINSGNLLDPTWHIAGTGDFNGDHDSDVLLRNDDGRTSIWEVTGFGIAKGATIAGAPLLDPTWHIEATGDFNADGKSDIVLRNDDGRLSIWQIDGTNLVRSATINPGSPLDPGWHVAGTGDFDGNGYQDILLRNDDGRVSIWEMNGLALMKGAIVANAPLLDASWHIEGTDDFNNDGFNDILLRNDDGRVSIWEMQGEAILKGVTVNPGSPLDPTWHVENHQHDLVP